MSGKSMSSTRRAPTRRHEIAHSYGAHVVQFHYQGGWPKKRQWAMESLPLAYDWIFLVDADEALTPELAEEIRRAIQDPDRRRLLHRTSHVFSRPRACATATPVSTSFRYFAAEKAASNAASETRTHPWPTWKFTSTCDGRTGVKTIARLKHPLLHHNVESLSRYIRSTTSTRTGKRACGWLGDARRHRSAAVFVRHRRPSAAAGLRKKLFALPGSPILFFLYKYSSAHGISGWRPGPDLLWPSGRSVFHIKAKIYELKTQAARRELSRIKCAASAVW